jgi:hypothetical protein
MADQLDSVDENTSPADEKWPIGFMLTIVLVVLYLGWRLIQMLGWLVTSIS